MDVWVAIINIETPDEVVLGVYTTEDLALSTAKRAAPEAPEARHYVLDEDPDWIHDYEQERERGG